MKKLVGIMVGIAIALLVVAIAKDIVIKAMVEKGVEIVTGLKLDIGTFKVGVLKPVVDIKNLKLFNAAGFKDRTMIDMPEIYVDYDLAAIFKNRIHLNEVRIDLKEFDVIKNEQGVLNLDSLKVVQAEKEGKSPTEKAAGKAAEIQIDSLKLRIGKVIYKDYSKGAEPDVKEFDLNLNESYSNINNPYAVVSLIVVRAMMNTTISGLTGFDLKGLSSTVSGPLGSAQEFVGGAMDKATQAVGTAQESVKTVTETTKNTTDAVGEAAGAVTDAFKGIFGSGKK